MVLFSSKLKRVIFLPNFKIFRFYRLWYSDLLRLKSHHVVERSFFPRFFLKPVGKRFSKSFNSRKRLFLPIRVIFLARRFGYRRKVFRKLFNYKFRKLIRFFKPVRYFRRRGYLKPFLYRVYKYLIARGQLFGSLLVMLVFLRLLDFSRISLVSTLLSRRGKNSFFSEQRHLFRFLFKLPYKYNHLRLFSRFSFFRRLSIFSNIHRFIPSRSKNFSLFRNGNNKSNLSIFLRRTGVNFPNISFDLIERLCFGLHFNSYSRQPVPVENFLLGVLGKPSSFKSFLGSRSGLFNLFFFVRQSFFDQQLRSLVSFFSKMGFFNPKCLYISDLFIFRKISLNILRIGSCFVFSKWQKGTFTNRFFSFFWVNFANTKFSFASGLSLLNLLPFYSTNNDTSSVSCIARNLVYFSPLSSFSISNPDFLLFSNLTESVSAFDESLKSGFMCLCFSPSILYNSSLFTLVGNAYWPIFQLLFMNLSILSLQMGREEFRNQTVCFFVLRYLYISSVVFKFYKKISKFFVESYKAALSFFSQFLFKFALLDYEEFSRTKVLRFFSFLYWNVNMVKVFKFLLVPYFRLGVLSFFKRFREFFSSVKFFLFFRSFLDSSSRLLDFLGLGKNFVSFDWFFIFLSFFHRIKGFFCLLKKFSLIKFCTNFFLGCFVLYNFNSNLVSRLRSFLFLFFSLVQTLNILFIKRFIYSFPLFFDFTTLLLDDISLLSYKGQKRVRRGFLNPVPKKFNFFIKPFGGRVWENLYLKKVFYFRSRAFKFNKRTGSRKQLRISSLVVSPSM